MRLLPDPPSNETGKREGGADLSSKLPHSLVPLHRGQHEVADHDTVGFPISFGNAMGLELKHFLQSDQQPEVGQLMSARSDRRIRPHMQVFHLEYAQPSKVEKA
jgi:hypothetical protein